MSLRSMPLLYSPVGKQTRIPKVILNWALILLHVGAMEPQGRLLNSQQQRWGAKQEIKIIMGIFLEQKL